MPYAPCPACAVRWVGAISPADCPVCDGEARLEINSRMALATGLEAWPDYEDTFYARNQPKIVELGARVISMSVWVGLARCARDTAGLSDAERGWALRDRVAGFRRCHLLGDGVPDGHECGCFKMLPGDGALLAGLCEAHRPPSRKRTRLGVPPAVSAHGHPSGFARLVDPVDLDSRPGKRFLDDRRIWNAADALDRAVTEVANTTRADQPGFDLIGAVA